MLNAKYIIVGGEKGSAAQPNPGALGNAWFVENYKIVLNADSEIAALSNFDPARTCVIDQRFTENLPENLKHEPSSTIKLKTYKANHLVYESNSASDEMAVFSEIYYANGWNAYVDGELMGHYRTNYVLRGMMVPKGNHTIEFKFEPMVYSVGEAISYVCSSLILIILFGAGFIAYKNKKIATQEEVSV